MKKFKGRDFISGVLVGSLLLSGVSYASSSIRLIVDGKEIQSDVPPQVIDGRTMVPARFLAESLGAKVDWDASSNSVIVTSKGDGYLDIPGNINPVFVFFKYLFVDSKVSQQQFKNNLDGEALADQLTRGINEVQFSDLREIARNNRQVEFSATFNVKRNKGYSGPLNEGVNQLFFLVEKEGDMVFKIVSYGKEPGLLTEEEHSGGLSETNSSNIPMISEPDVVRLAAKAKDHYWYISSGGGSTSEGEIKEFPIEGKGWRIDENIETIREYVNQAVIVTSKESSQKLNVPENKETFIYKDQEFMVSLPIDWKDKIKAEKKDNETHFYYQPADPSKQPDYLFGIDLIQKKDWDESGYAEIGFFTLLGTKQDKVYALHKPSETPYANYPDSIEYQEVRQMLINLKESIQFRLLQ